MANTQGMSDEGMASLLTTAPNDNNALSPSTDHVSRTNKRAPSAFKKQRAALERRLMMQDPGHRPAATVVRRSPPNNREARTSAETNNQSKCDAATIEEAPSPTTVVPVLGSIVERPVHQQNQQQRRQPPRMISPLGSPSVHVPLGTFCSREKKNQRQESAGKSDGFSSKQKSSSPLSEAGVDRDSDAMLAQMTSSEIRESVEELHAELSPEMIQFLKNRKAQTKKKQEGESSTEKRPPGDKQQTGDSALNLQTMTREPTAEDNVVKEKGVHSVESNVMHWYPPSSENENNTQSNNGVENTENEFLQACTLLRSTSPQQVLWAARAVCHSLGEQQQMMTSGNDKTISDAPSFEYPTLLPVSLRCLLDETPVSGEGILLLHSYVLRSFYSLLCLTAPSDHVIEVNQSRENSTINSSAVYQEFFMDDSIPTPPLDAYYSSASSAQPLKMGNETVAYATSSSTTSAQADGEAFRKDPMWTLLSRMRIIPQLTLLLSYNLPDEALIATCGILAMLAVRSPGAAAAIAQHAQLLPRLLKKIGLLPPTDSRDVDDSHCDATVRFASLLLLNTLARQSRAVAASLPFDLIVPPLLGQTADSVQEFNVQRQCLILWRTMLRYGLGLAHISTFVTLAVPHVAVMSVKEESQHRSLITEYLTAFALVCEYMALFRSQPELALSNRNHHCEALFDTSWLSSLVKQCCQYLCAIQGSSVQAVNKHNCDRARLHSACMRFVSSCLLLDAVIERRPENENSKMDDGESFKTVDANQCCDALSSLWESGIVKTSVEALSPCLGAGVAGSRASDEAVASAFVEAFTCLLSMLYNGQPDETQHRLATLLTRPYRSLLLNDFCAGRNGNAPNDHSASSKSTPVARIGWLNRAHFSMCKFLMETSNPEEMHADLPLLRSFASILLAKLEHGEEAIAEYLFQQDVLFRPLAVPKQKDSARTPLATMFLRELHSTEQSQIQLNHSFKLLHRVFGEFVNSEVDTLLSTADSQRLKQPMNSSDLLLPLGDIWLWHVLSGSVSSPSEMGKNAQDAVWTEVSDIVSSCLGILYELEQDNSLYAAEVPNGAKLYHLFNVCMYPESVIREKNIGDLVIALFGKYTGGFADSSLEVGFMEECYRHSQTSKGQEKSGNDPNNDDEEAKKLALLEDLNSISKEVLALDNFAGDLCNVYIDYGAQYDAFTMCIRFLLKPGFPPKVRCETIHNLRHVLHLLTLPVEEAHPAGPSMERVLKSTLVGGLPSRDESVRDAPQVLDMVASVLKGSESASRWTVAQDSFFFLFSVALLARSLAINISIGASTMAALNRRMQELPIECQQLVLNTCSRFLSSPNGDKSDLVRAVIDICVNKSMSEEATCLAEEKSWEKAVDSLRLKFSALRS